jgi:hypothetical protein
MSIQGYAGRLKQEAAEFNLYSVRVGMALSLVVSLGAMAILSKNLVSHWLFLPALTVPVSLALYFRSRMAVLGPFMYAAALIVILTLAILFGM